VDKETGNSKRTMALRKAMFLSLSLALIISLLAACSKSGESSSAERHVLRVGTLYGGPQDEQYFRQQYTDSYELNHDNIDIEIVSAINYNDQRFNQPKPGEQQKQPDPYEELKKMMTGDNPVDVIVVDYNYLRRMVQDNMLKQLDPLIQQDKFDLTDYVPTVMDGLKSVGDDNLYALTPTFSSSALYFNKKLFHDAGVEVPTDGMMWQDVFNLAARVATGTGKDRKYGFSFNRWPSDPFSDTQVYAQPLQLKTFDDKGEKMTVNTPEWERVWTTVAKLYKDKTVPNTQEIQQNPQDQKAVYNPYNGDLFMNGQVAMVIGEYGYINDITTANDNADKIEGFQKLDWDVVTVPQFPEKAGVGGNIFLSSLMGINAKAQNSDDAWDFIKFLNGRAWAKLKSRSMYEMTARKEFLKPRDGVTFNMDAFTKLKPVPPQTTDQEKIYRDMPNIWQVQNLAQPLFQEVIKGTKTSKEALAEWETKGNDMLKQIKANPNGPIDGGGTIYMGKGGYGG
jgi:multiple sugar transport system substrate-binding protein